MTAHAPAKGIPRKGMRMQLRDRKIRKQKRGRR